MKIDLDQVLKDVWGHPILEAQPRAVPDGDAAAGVPMTLGKLVAAAFLTPTKADETATSVEAKLAVYRYARLGADGGKVDVTVEQLGDIRKRVAAVYHAALAGPALEALDLGEAAR